MAWLLGGLLSLLGALTMSNWPQPMLRPVDCTAISAKVSVGYRPSFTAGQFPVIAIGALAHAFTKNLQEIMPGYFFSGAARKRAILERDQRRVSGSISTTMAVWGILLASQKASAPLRSFVISDRLVDFIRN